MLERKRHISFALAIVCVFACAVLLQVVPATAYGAEYLTAAKVDWQLATQNDSSASPTNGSVTDAETPRTTDEAGLIWSVKFDKGYVSPGVIVGDEIIVTSGRGKNGIISKLDKKTGKVIAEASMKKASAFSLIAPTYADGKVFVTLSDGSMEAFDAKTLKSLWYYQHEDGGQGNCPIVYSDGLVYTGYWGGETADRSFVCLNAKTGKLVWERANTGGYYWVGALAVGDYLLFGCDDGKPEAETGVSYVRCVDKKTGEVISSVEVTGDQRSSIAYDSELGRIYFTSKPGLLYSAKLNAETGMLSGLKSLSIGTSTTATPLVYDGRVYVGASSGGFSEGSLSVVDAASLSMLYQLGKSSGINGTVKSTPLVSTAYVDKGTNEGDGKLYLYFTVNNPPGGITMVSVDPGSTKADQAKVVDLFTPPSEIQQYCIANVICDDDGNLYYRNDSNYLMCVGPSGDDPSGDEPSGDDPSGGDPSGDDSQDGGGSSDPSGKDSGTDGSDSGSGKGGTKPSGDNSSGGNSSGGSSSGGNASPGQDSSGSNGSAAGGSSTRRNTPIQYGGNASGAGGSSSRVGAAGTSGSGSNTSANGSDATAESKDDKKDGQDKKNAVSDASFLSDSTRHTDAVAATNHLEETSTPGTPGWFMLAIVGIVALACLAAAFIARMLLARRSSDDDEDGSYYAT